MHFKHQLEEENISFQMLHHSLCIVKHSFHSTKKPVTTMLTYPWKCTVLHCNHLASTRAIIKVLGHQHQWFPGVSQVVTM